MKKLSSSQIRSIVSQYQNSGDQNLMLPVIHTLSDMIDELSRRYPTQAGAVETSDLVLEGQMAVISAAELYDIDSQLDFQHFVFDHIRNAIRAFFNSYSMPVTRPPRSRKQLYFDSLDANIIHGDGELIDAEQYTREDNLLTMPVELDPVDYSYVHQALSTLTPIEQQVITLLYGLDDHKPLSEAAIAGRLHTTISRIHGIRMRAQRKLNIRMRSAQPHNV